MIQRLLGRGKWRRQSTYEYQLGRYGSVSVLVTQFPDRAMSVTLQDEDEQRVAFDPMDLFGAVEDIRTAVALLRVHGN